MSAVLSIRNVSKTFMLGDHEIKAVQDVSIDVAEVVEETPDDVEDD